MTDISDIIQKTIDAGKPFVIPVGEHYIGKPVYLKNDDILICGSLPTNGGNVLWTDKPIDMFRVEGKINRPRLVGFTAKYVGDKIYGNECAVVRLGGHGETRRRFGVLHGEFDYDVIGDERYMRSRWNKNRIEDPRGYEYLYWKNPDYDFAINEPFDNVDNYTCSYTGGGVHGFWVDYNTEISERTSWFHTTKIRGSYYWVNTALKIDKKFTEEHPINSIDAILTVNAAKTFFFLRGVGRSKIEILGQNRNTRQCTYPLQDGNIPTWEEIMLPYYFVDKCEKSNISWFMWDRKATGRSEHGGFVRGNGLDWTGWGTLSSAKNIDAYYQEGLNVSGPHVVNTSSNQEIGGLKSFSKAEIRRYGEMNVVDGAELRIGDTGRFFIGDSRIRPQETIIKDLEWLYKTLEKTGIIKLR